MTNPFEGRSNKGQLEEQALKYTAEAILNSGDPWLSGVVEGKKIPIWPVNQQERKRFSDSILNAISPELLKAHGAKAGTLEAERILAEFNNSDRLIAALEQVKKESIARI